MVGYSCGDTVLFTNTGLRMLFFAGGSTADNIIHDDTSGGGGGDDGRTTAVNILTGLRASRLNAVEAV